MRGSFILRVADHEDMRDLSISALTRSAAPVDPFEVQSIGKELALASDDQRGLPFGPDHGQHHDKNHHCLAEPPAVTSDSNHPRCLTIKIHKCLNNKYIVGNL